MTNRKKHHFLIRLLAPGLLALSMLLAGCAALPASSPVKTAAPVKTATPATRQVTPSPLPSLPAGPPTPVAGLSAAGIDLGSIQIDSGALRWQPVIIPAEPYSASGGKGAARGWPEHVAVLFGITRPEQWNPSLPFLRIYRLADYQQLWQQAGDERINGQAQRLQELLAGPAPAELDGLMPILPLPPGKMGRWMQYKQLDSQVGPGLRFIADTPLRPFPGPVTNQDLAYYYQGLTSDGQYYLSFFFPISAPGLPSSTLEVPSDLAAQFSSMESAGAYMTELRQRLDNLPPDAWTPSLDLMDRLVQSIQFTILSP